VEDTRDFFGRGEKAAKVGFLAVSVVGALKGLVGFFSGSVSLLAQSIESLTDLFSLVAVYVGMRLSKKPPSERFPYGYYRFETLASLAIAILIIITGGGILRESILMVLDPQPISANVYAITVAASSIPVLYLLTNYTERIGNEINSQALLGQAADFKSDMYSSFLVLVGIGAVEQAHRISEEVEHRVKEKIPSVESLIIHIEPQKQERPRVAIPVLEDKGIGSPVTPHFGEAPYFLFVDVERESIHRWYTRQNPALGLDRKRGVTISELIIGENTTTLLTTEIGEGPYHILRDSFIEICELPEKTTVEEAIKIFLSGKLERIEKGNKGKKR
jgi:predicted Fe-Mo cluster-binding NifX family protein